jgi:hypothetical protein
MSKRGQKKNQDYEQERTGIMIMKGLKFQAYEHERREKSG